MSTRSAAEVWRKLVEEAGEEEIDLAATVTVAQAERELVRAGFDVAAERARAEGLLEWLDRGQTKPRG